MTASGRTTGERRLIVNGDDFGQTSGINEGIVRCHEQGILTSASLMVRWLAARDAAAYARATPTLGVGLHLDLGEWAYRDGEWVPLYVVVPTDDPAEVQEEVERQLEAFRDLVGANPTHLDSHQHVHRRGPASQVIIGVGAALGVPVRHFGPVVYQRGFYGLDAAGRTLEDALTVDRLIAILDALPVGSTELGCHPGLGDDAPGMYVSQRAVEVLVLCDPRVRAALEAKGIHLISFAQV